MADNNKMTDTEVVDALAKFRLLHAEKPTTHTDIMTQVLTYEAKVRGLI